MSRRRRRHLLVYLLRSWINALSAIQLKWLRLMRFCFIIFFDIVVVVIFLLIICNRYTRFELWRCYTVIEKIIANRQKPTSGRSLLCCGNFNTLSSLCLNVDVVEAHHIASYGWFVRLCFCFSPSASSFFLFCLCMIVFVSFISLLVWCFFFFLRVCLKSKAFLIESRTTQFVVYVINLYVFFSQKFVCKNQVK